MQKSKRAKVSEFSPYQTRLKRISGSIFADYSYSEYPVINGRGFEIKVSSDEEVRSFLAEYAPDNADYFNKWMKFDTYRKVVFSK